MRLIINKLTEADGKAFHGKHATEVTDTPHHAPDPPAALM